MSPFKLIKGVCTDTNCQIVNQITNYCEICLPSYKINVIGACKYIDPNCKTFNSNSECVNCFNGYIIKNNSSLCVYQDLNCLLFNNSTGLCQT